MFKRKLLYNKSARIWLYDTTTNTSVLPDDIERVNATIKSEKTLKKLRFCCDLAAECCRSNAKYLPQPDPISGELADREGGDFCPATWDGIGCWPNSPAGQMARQRCTKNSYVNLDMNPACGGDVKKQCFANGTWLQRGDHEWSDFAQCSDIPVSIFSPILWLGLQYKQSQRVEGINELADPQLGPNRATHLSLPGLQHSPLFGSRHVLKLIYLV